MKQQPADDSNMVETEHSVQCNGFDAAAFAEHVRILFVKPDDHVGRILHACVGVAGEGGELLDTAKKAWIYGAPLNRENLLEEAGDTLFYVVALLNELGFTLEQAAAHNVEKLRKRYPAGYTDAAAQARADKADGK